jgi:hypothetical protein
MEKFKDSAVKAVNDPSPGRPSTFIITVNAGFLGMKSNKCTANPAPIGPKPGL